MYHLAASGPVLAELSYWQLMVDGGLTNLFILLLSIVALATAVERLVNQRPDRLVTGDAVAEVRGKWDAGSPHELEEFCRRRGGIFGEIVAFVSQHRDRDYASVSAAASDLASVAIRRHLQRIYPLALVATLAPLAGLCGTVLGMVETFHTVAETGQTGNVGLLASGIYKALSTTAAGLIVAIPALGAYHYFRMKIRSASLLLEEAVNELLTDRVLRRTK